MDLMKTELVLYKDISKMIEQSRRVIYSRVNAETVLLFGKSVNASTAKSSIINAPITAKRLSLRCHDN